MQSMAPRIVQRKSGGKSVETMPDTASDVRRELAFGTGLPSYAYVIILARYTAGEMRIAIRVRPGSARPGADGEHAGALVVRGLETVASFDRFPVWINAHSSSYAGDSARGRGGCMVSLWQLMTFFPVRLDVPGGSRPGSARR
jgi:hypothetical protein